MPKDKSSPSEPLFIGGPDFDNDDNRGWLREKGSKIILPLIAIAVLAGGIYWYSQVREAPLEETIEEELANDTLTPISDNQTETPQVEEKKVEQKDQTKPETDSTSAPQQEEKVAKEGQTYKIKAQKGEGTTHLARKILKDYISQHDELKDKLSKEHKIYIEDYLKDKTYSKGLIVGQELSFDENLIKEAIDKSQELSESQLKSLEKYSKLVPSL